MIVINFDNIHWNLTDFEEQFNEEKVYTQRRLSIPEQISYDNSIYIPHHKIETTGITYVNDDIKLTSLQFMEYIKYDPYFQTNTNCSIIYCPNINFKLVPQCIKKLCINYCHLKCIDGLSKMSVKELDLSWNDLTDISELKYLRSDLTELRLNNNNIIDISPLGLNPETHLLYFALNYLDLSFNQIINIEALKYQHSLESLLLFNNFIHNFSPIENHNLEVSYCDDQQELNAVQLNYQNNYQTIIKVNILHNKVKQQKKHIFRIIYKTSICKILSQAQQNHQYSMEQAVYILKQTYQDNFMCYQ
ncbi:chitobiase/beta-hexosaminidase_C-terminal domain-containing protein [Hexamita inflata]|uniref:Chitobiase/beta-hexosaminidase C-terminal domain-containing protein n=1 Tax=Hexamita inflata TaxID=28002 RepID=A0AA86N5V5_9EUKA|nr:chitobiase/beta-hexosaminidase C-terminal domain-containing protein [Hexamita inflata]